MSREAPTEAPKTRESSHWGQLGTVSVGLVIAYFPTWAPSAFRKLGLDLPGDGPITALWVNWLAVIVLLGYVFLVERAGLASLLMTHPNQADLEWALYFFGAVMAYSWVASLIREQPLNEGTETIAAMPVLAVIALVITTGITEEILFRGYPIERLTTLTGRRWIGATVSIMIFVAPHLVFFSPDWLLYQGFGTAAIYALYLWRRNLYACMLLHVLINAPILIPAVMQ